MSLVFLVISPTDVGKDLAPTTKTSGETYIRKKEE